MNVTAVQIKAFHVQNIMEILYWFGEPQIMRTSVMVRRNTTKVLLNYHIKITLTQPHVPSVNTELHSSHIIVLILS